MRKTPKTNRAVAALTISVSDLPQWTNPVGRPVCDCCADSLWVACLDRTGSDLIPRVVTANDTWSGNSVLHPSLAFGLQENHAALICGSQCWVSTSTAEWRSVDAALTGAVELSVEGRLHETAMFGWTAAGRQRVAESAELWLRTSPDTGATWYDFKQDMLPSQNPDVQSLLYWRGMLIVIAWGAAADGMRAAQQCVGRHGRLPLTPTGTNIRGDAGSQLDLAYNPTTSRFELLGLTTVDGRACLQQWSLPPHEMTAGSGEWRGDGEIWHADAKAAILGHSVVDADGVRHVPLVLDGGLHVLELQI